MRSSIIIILVAVILVVLIVASTAVLATSLSSRLRHTRRRGGVGVGRLSSAVDDIFVAANFSGHASFGRFYPFRAHQEVNFSKKYGNFSPKFPQVPWPEHPTFPIASNTKVYVAISLYQLAATTKKFKLHDDVADYLSKDDLAAMGIRNQSKFCPRLNGQGGCLQITFANLLSMSSCIGDDYSNQFLPYSGSFASVLARYDLLRLVCEPGATYYYSNPAFMMGAFFVEKFSGMPFSEYIAQKITQPLGMAATYFSVYDNKFQLDLNQADEFYHYINADDRAEYLGLGSATSEFTMGSAGGAGGIISTQADERRLYSVLFNVTNPEGAPLLGLTRADIIDIIKPRTLIAPGNYYAQGLFIYTAPAGTTEATAALANGVPATAPQLINIQYEGQIMDSWTANLLDFTVTPPAMAQAWSTQRVFYPTKQQWEDTLTLKQPSGKNFFEITNGWGKQTGYETLAQNMIDIFDEV